MRRSRSTAAALPTRSSRRFHSAVRRRHRHPTSRRTNRSWPRRSSPLSTPPASPSTTISSTRWSSQFSDPQWIYVDLGQTYAISEVILRWETAFGADYQVQVSNDATDWTTIRAITGGDGDVDDLAGLFGTGRYVRILGTRRGTEWGYSLWEFAVYGTPVGPPPPPDLALNKPVVVSSEFSSQYAGRLAVDGDRSTRWSSEFSDPQWIYVDLGQRVGVTLVRLAWEAAYGADFEIQLSDDALSWTTLVTAVNNTQLANSFGVFGIGRYVRVYGTRRATEWGYSLWSFEVYGDPAPRSPTGRSISRPSPAATSRRHTPRHARSTATRRRAGQASSATRSGSPSTSASASPSTKSCSRGKPRTAPTTKSRCQMTASAG